jgi:hypothetical protein
MALAALVAIQGPKKSRIQGPPLTMALVMDIARLKNISYRVIQTTGTRTLIVILATFKTKGPLRANEEYAKLRNK